MGRVAPQSRKGGIVRILHLLLVALAVFFGVQRALAHDTSLASVQVRVSADGKVDFQLFADPAFIAEDSGLVENRPKGAWKGRYNTLTKLLRQGAPALRGWLDAGLEVRADGHLCKGAQAIRQDFKDMPTESMVARVYDCGAPLTSLSMRYQLFFKTDKTHVALGNVFWPGDVMGDFLFDNITHEVRLKAPESGAGARAAPSGAGKTAAPRRKSQPVAGGTFLSRFWHIFLLGIEHILTGYDHILFVLSLIIGAPWLRQIVKVVTAFTISHSLTLALAWFGVIDIPSWMVESAIAASIAVVAAQNMLVDKPGHRWMLAGGFGLIHGLGFATALKGLDLRDNVTMTLLAFNLGVETGQLSIVLALAPVLIWWRDKPWHRTTAVFLSGIILAIALFWMVQRLFFS